LELSSIRFSWFSPTRITGFTIRDHAGDRVVESPRATWDRNLRQLLFDHPRLGTLTLDGASLDVERGEGGSIDLYEALEPILSPKPKLDLTVQITNGSLQFRTTGGLKPVTAQRLDVVLHIAPQPRPLTWRVDLGHTSESGKLSVVGRLDRWNPSADGHKDLAVEIVSQTWPFAVSRSKLDATAALSGRFQFLRHEGNWDLDGSAGLADVRAGGAALKGDQLDWPSLNAHWRVVQDAKGWSVRQLNVSSPVGTITGRGVLPAIEEASQLEADLDLAALANQLPNALGLPRDATLQSGKVRLQLESKPGNSGSSWNLEGRTSDLVARLRDETLEFRDPAVLHADVSSIEDGARFNGRLDVGKTPWTDRPLAVRLEGSYHATPRELTIARLVVNDRHGALDAKGHIRGSEDRPFVSLSGRVAPDWQWVNETLTQKVEPGAHVEGDSISFEAQGPISLSSSDLLKDLKADMRAAVREVDIYGLRVGSTVIHAQTAGGKISIEPIDTTLNGGRVHLEPELVRDEEYGMLLRLGSNSTIADAEINDEVSHRVLAFLVPVMDRATRAHGKVSVDVSRAEIPLRSDAGRRAVVEGEVVFSNVEFAPGPLAQDLLVMVGRPDLPALRLNEPVVMSVADGKVYQRGLAIPVGKLTQIRLEGTVDFERNLDLVASMPLTPAMFGNTDLLSGITAGMRLDLPIRGTLSKPKIDKEAFTTALKDMGKTFLQRGAVFGAAELLERLTRPRDPNAPPPPPRMTPEERRAQRLQRKDERRERKQERRMNRG
jgi:hypothetical protein